MTTSVQLELLTKNYVLSRMLYKVCRETYIPEHLNILYVPDSHFLTGQDINRIRNGELKKLEVISPSNYTTLLELTIENIDSVDWYSNNENIALTGDTFDPWIKSTPELYEWLIGLNNRMITAIKKYKNSNNKNKENINHIRKH